MNAQKRIANMEKIVEEHTDLIEAIENTKNWNLFDCRYTDKGVELSFNDCKTNDKIIMTLERVEHKESNL